ncbi:hypothetical protein CGRA01v4_03037 [Colletotrichum graminicola]|nr:hypothetical protein CGRA01v4_03037 [Colletotrichum graminicola]
MVISRTISRPLFIPPDVEWQRTKKKRYLVRGLVDCFDSSGASDDRCHRRIRKKKKVEGSCGFAYCLKFSASVVRSRGSWVWSACSSSRPSTQTLPTTDIPRYKESLVELGVNLEERCEKRFMLFGAGWPGEAARR